MSSELIRLREVMDKLRSPGGCPWDAEQDHTSLLKYLLEESYEFIESVENNDREAMQEELGDLLLQTQLNIKFTRRPAAHLLSYMLPTNLNLNLGASHNALTQLERNAALNFTVTTPAAGGRNAASVDTQYTITGIAINIQNMYLQVSKIFYIKILKYLKLKIFEIVQYLKLKLKYLKFKY